MTKTSEDVKGITTRRKSPVVVPVDDDAENQFISKEAFIAKRAQMKAASEAATAAHAAVMGKAVSKSEAKRVAIQKEEDTNDELINELRHDLAEVESELKSDPDNKALLKKKNKIAKELDKAEDN